MEITAPIMVTVTVIRYNVVENPPKIIFRTCKGTVYQIATFQGTRDVFLFTCAENVVDKESCILLYDLNT